MGMMGKLTDADYTELVFKIETFLCPIFFILIPAGLIFKKQYNVFSKATASIRNSKNDEPTYLATSNDDISEG